MFTALNYGRVKIRQDRNTLLQQCVKNLGRFGSGWERESFFALVVSARLKLIAKYPLDDRLLVEPGVGIAEWIR